MRLQVSYILSKVYDLTLLFRQSATITVSEDRSILGYNSPLPHCHMVGPPLFLSPGLLTSCRLTRISLALGIARIFPPRHITRRFSIGLAFLSTALCLMLIIQISAVCSRQPMLRERAVCIWPLSLRVLVIVGGWYFAALIFYYCLADPSVASCLADLFLVVTPLYKLWKVRLPKEQRRLILGGFTAGFTTTAITLVCAGFQYAPTDWEPAKGFIRGNLTFFEVILLSQYFTLVNVF